MSRSTASPNTSRLRPLVAAAAALLMTLTGATAAAASAGTTSPDASRAVAKTVTYTAPAAPALAHGGVREVSRGMGPMAVPTVSPAARAITYVPANSDYPCNVGELCALAWDTSRNMYKVFHLYSCARYSLSGWVGQGFYNNRQTTGTVARFYNSAGATLWTSTAPSGHHNANWDPVWSIRNC
jgi:hypothetical protein